jgi:hypothetical protein
MEVFSIHKRIQLFKMPINNSHLHQDNRKNFTIHFNIIYKIIRIIE